MNNRPATGFPIITLITAIILLVLAFKGYLE